jgi:hypothetical protein
MSGIAAAVPAADAMNVRRSNPEMVLEDGRSDIDGLRRCSRKRAHPCAVVTQQHAPADVPKRIRFLELKAAALSHS